MDKRITETNAGAPASSSPVPGAQSSDPVLRRFAGPLLWCVGLLVPVVLDPGWITVGGIFATYAIVALSQDIVLGRAGMYDMGHAVYFGVGAYIAAILSLTFGWPILWTIPVPVVVSAARGAIRSEPIVKPGGDP